MRTRAGGLLLLAVLMSGCITEPELKLRGDARPIAAGDGWPIGEPREHGFDEALLSRALVRFYADSVHRNAISLLVARDGVLVVEAYTRPRSEATVARNVQSVTKSVTALTFGAAAEEAPALADLATTLFDVLGDRVPPEAAKREITLEHLLTMRSGIAFENDRFALETIAQKPRDQLRHILGKPMYGHPGAEFRYRDADPQLLAYAVAAATGSGLEEIAARRIFGPLGIRDYYWERNSEGVTLGAFSLHLTPRDLARIGQLVLQEGRWGDTELVPREWVRRATSMQTLSNRGGRPYGYYWWMVPELDAFAAVGHGGNFLLISRDKGVVIAMTSLPHAVDETGTTLDGFIPLARLILDAADQ